MPFGLELIRFAHGSYRRNFYFLLLPPLITPSYYFLLLLPVITSSYYFLLLLPIITPCYYSLLLPKLHFEPCHAPEAWLLDSTQIIISVRGDIVERQ